MARKFEVAKGFEDQNINLPKRSTKHSAGYDIEAAEDVWVHPWFMPSNELCGERYNHKATLIKTGVKVQMNDGEFLGVYPRSSTSVKNLALMPNSIGVIDQDYYNNEDNDGHIMVPFVNFGEKSIHIKKGERIAQGIFHKYETVDNEDIINTERQGGFGSTGKQ